MWSAQTQTAAWCVIFFFASAGASAAYLTVSEIFPMETRAMAIAFFYAVGTAIGGITGPLLFGKLVATKDVGQVFWGYILAAALMIGAGIVQAILGIEAAQKNLEDVAKPLSAQAAEGAEDDQRPAADTRAHDKRRPPAQLPGRGRQRVRFGPSESGTSCSPILQSSSRAVPDEDTKRRGGRPGRRPARSRTGRAGAERAGHPGQLPPVGARPLPARSPYRRAPRRHPPQRTIALRRGMSIFGGERAVLRPRASR